MRCECELLTNLSVINGTGKYQMLPRNSNLSAIFNEDLLSAACIIPGTGDKTVALTVLCPHSTRKAENKSRHKVQSLFTARNK